MPSTHEPDQLLEPSNLLEPIDLTDKGPMVTPLSISASPMGPGIVIAPSLWRRSGLRQQPPH
jgi:hypothetical protein